MAKTRVLVVDDEISIIKFLRANLENEGYKVLTAIDGANAMHTIEIEPPDLVILDIIMPKMDGFEVCRQLREWSQIPIIMLSARGDEDDKVKCLELGADDYVTKPFGAKELIARVKALLRRNEVNHATPPKPFFVSGDLKVDFIEKRLTVEGKEVELTPTEYNLLKEFTLNAGKTLTHSYMLGKIWGPEYRMEREYLHVFVRRLRAKLGSNTRKRRYIKTVPRVGYRFEMTA